MDNSNLINLEEPAMKIGSAPHIEPINPIPPLPVLNPQLSKDLLAYLEAMELLQEMRQKLKEMAAGLKHMKNVMFGVVEIMNMFQNIEGGKIRALSAVDNIASDIRSEVSNAQGGVNAIAGADNKNGSTTPTKAEIADAKKFLDFINQIQAFIDAHGGAKGVIGNATLKNLQDAVNNIKKQFTNDWGNPKYMAIDILRWVKESKSGKFAPELKNLQFGFQQLNQTVSALSTTTNTNLQFTSEMFKQFLGIDESAMQSYQKGNLQMVQNQRSN